MFEQIINQVAENVTNIINNYIINPAVAFMGSLPWYGQALILLAIAIILLFGIVSIIKSTWKFLLIILFLGALAFGVWYFAFGGDVIVKEGILKELFKTFIFLM